MWRRDPSAWSDAADVQATIANRLGWLDSPALMADSLDRLQAFADGVKRDGFTDVVLLGMGGSSLAPEVLRSIVGTAPGWPRFHMLDSTDPDAIRAAATPPRHTLYLLASKSGTTIEPNTLAAHFRRDAGGRGHRALGESLRRDHGRRHRARASGRAPSRFATSSSTRPTSAAATRRCRSSASCRPRSWDRTSRRSSGWGLAMLSAARRRRRDAAGQSGRRARPLHRRGRARGPRQADAAPAAGTRVVRPLGRTTRGRKHGQERRRRRADRGRDQRATRRVRTRSPVRRSVRVPATARATPQSSTGSRPPDIRRRRSTGPNLPALGAEFVRWEIATAIAGALLGINPFDEPNVQQAKDATTTLLGAYQVERRAAARGART